MTVKSKTELENLKQKLEEKLKIVEIKIEKLKPNPIGFQYNNKK